MVVDVVVVDDVVVVVVDVVDVVVLVEVVVVLLDVVVAVVDVVLVVLVDGVVVLLVDVVVVLVDDVVLVLVVVGIGAVVVVVLDVVLVALELVVLELVVVVVVPAPAPVSCARPARETAPGPGRSAEESTSRSKLGGTQKVLTRVAGFAGPPATKAPAADPIIVMLRAGLSEESVAAKAPVLCWPQLVKPVTLVQSAFDLHGTAGLLNELLTLLRQKPQKTFGWSGRSVALTDVAPVPSTKLMASGEPITRPAGGGQSWLVGYASLSGESPGVQVRPSFGPPLQTRVVALQIGHVWMSVLQVPPAQSSFVMQPKPASLPPTHRPRSQEPPTPQSGFARHAVSAGLVPRRHRPVSFWHVPPPGQSAAVLQDAPGFEPSLQRSGSRSPVRKRLALSGSLRSVTDPAEQSAVPWASCATRMMRQVLVGAPPLLLFGIGSGAWKRQPLPVQVRMLPVSACVVAPRVSAVPLHAVTRSDETPVSGTSAGRGTASFTPPK